MSVKLVANDNTSQEFTKDEVNFNPYLHVPLRLYFPLPHSLLFLPLNMQIKEIKFASDFLDKEDGTGELECPCK